MKKYLLVLAFVGLPVYAVAGDKGIPLRKGMRYQTADIELRRSGWYARTMHEKDKYTYVGIENTMRGHGVQGIESCAVDRPVCIIHYVKGNMCLRLVTWGEEFKNIKIDSWSSECPANE